ncbi:MAG: Dabb family protein, partial [Phycisphaerales bacterium JB041]
LLGPIPGVTSLTCGRHLETGRSIVLSDYDVGVSVGLASEAAYQDYLAHPKHLELLDRWGSTIASYRIFDIQQAPSR